MGKITNTAAAFIPGFSLGFVFAALFGKKRDLLADAVRVSKRLKPVYVGLENIPKSGPLALAPNHYGDTKFHVFWSMFAITNAVAQQRESTLAKNERVATWLVQNQMPRRNGSDVQPGTFTPLAVPARASDL